MTIQKALTEINYIEVTLDETVLKQLEYDVKYEEDDWAELQLISLKKNEQDVTILNIPANYNYKGKKYKITQIAKRVFAGGAFLTSITISDNVKEIGYNAFWDVDTIYYNGNAKGSTWGANQVINDNYNYIEVKLNDTVLEQLGYNVKFKNYGEDLYQKTYLKKDGQYVETLDIPSTYSYKGKKYKIVHIGNCVTFWGCKSLKNVIIPKSVTIIGDSAFYRCESLTNITIPDSFTQIGYAAFWYCESLTNVMIPNSVTSIGDCSFWSCYSLENVTISNSITQIGENVFYHCVALKNINIPDSVVKIDSDAFEGCESLTSLTIPDSVEEIDSYAFSDCESLESVILSKNVTKIPSSAFSSCKALTNINIPKSVIKIDDDAFSGCVSLISITIPDSVEEIGYNAFCGVETIYYNGNAKSSTWGANQVINNNYNYIEVKLNETVLKHLGYDIKYENYGEPTIQKINLKKNGEDVTNLDIPATYTYNDKNYKITQIGNCAFAGYELLTSVTIPDSVTFIGRASFYNCSSLKSITIPNSVTGIYDNAFAYCKSLTNIIIPNSVTKIGADAFEDIPHIEYYGTATGAPWGAKSMN